MLRHEIQFDLCTLRVERVESCISEHARSFGTLFVLFTRGQMVHVNIIHTYIKKRQVKRCLFAGAQGNHIKPPQEEIA